MKNAYSRIHHSSIAVVLLIAFFAGSAQAALNAVGPTDPVTTLPTWYRDTADLALALCVDQNPYCVVTPQFDPLITFPPDPITTTGPIDDTNFPDESFYFLADASMNVNGDQARLRLALEAAFLGGVFPGGGGVFLRVNLQQMRGLPPNRTFTVTHPFGSFQFQTDAAGNASAQGGAAFRAEDPIAPAGIGNYFPPDLQAATNTNIGPFLKATGGFIIDPVSGNTYLGDPAIPVTVTGSPTGNNFFRITGTDIGGPGINIVQTPLFTLAGKVYIGPIATPLTVDRATYAQDAATTKIDVFAVSGPVSNLGTPSALQITGTGIPTTGMTMNAAGDAYAHISIPNPATLPASITVTNISDNAAVPTRFVAPLVDEVDISQANFNPADNSLTIQAASRDQLNPPALAAGLSAADNTLGALNAAGTRVVANLAVPPPAITVNSANGGSATVPISVALPPPAAGLTLSASPVSPIAGGGIVAFTATAGGTGPYEYQFMGRLAGQATFSLAQPYGPSNVFNWNTAGILSGTYEIQVQVRHVGAAVPFEATQSLNYTVTTPVATGVTITASPASPQLPGTNVTFTANATGGGVYEYQFIGRLVGSPVFSVARNYDPINTWTWNTTGVAPGQYEIVVLARAAGSTAAFEATATIFYTVSASTIAVSLGATPPSPATAGSSVTFTATATPAGGNYEYQFLGRRVGDPAFSIAQTYGPSNTWIWGSVAGSWEMQVQVRNVGSAEPFEAQQTIVYTVN